MAEPLLRVRRDQVKSNIRGWLQYIDDNGTLRRMLASRVEILDCVEVAPDADPAIAAQEAVEVEVQAEPTLDQQFAATLQDTTPSPEPEQQAAAEEPKAPKAPRTRAAKPQKSNGEPQVATAAKKSAPKKAAASQGSVRTIGGKSVDLSKYEKSRAPGGGVSYNNGDGVAKQLSGKTLDEVYGIVAKKAKRVEKELRTKFAHLNAGMQRMNLGNMLRKLSKST